MFLIYFFNVIKITSCSVFLRTLELVYTLSWLNFTVSAIFGQKIVVISLPVFLGLVSLLFN